MNRETRRANLRKLQLPSTETIHLRRTRSATISSISHYFTKPQKTGNQSACSQEENMSKETPQDKLNVNDIIVKTVGENETSAVSDIIELKRPKRTKLRSFIYKGKGEMPALDRASPADDFVTPAKHIKKAPRLKRVAAAGRPSRTKTNCKNRQPSIQSAFLRNEQIFAEITAQHCIADDVNPDDMQLALAISQSEAIVHNERQARADEEIVVDLLNVGDLAATEHHVQESIRSKLQKYGFQTAAHENYNNLAALFIPVTAERRNKRKWASKFSALTLRNPETQAERLKRRVADFLSQQCKTRSLSAGEVFPSFYTLLSSSLKKCEVAQTVEIINPLVTHKPIITKRTTVVDGIASLENFFVRELFDVTHVKAGHLLKNWELIPGRDLSPQARSKESKLAECRLQDLYKKLEKTFPYTERRLPVSIFPGIRNETWSAKPAATNHAISNEINMANCEHNPTENPDLDQIIELITKNYDGSGDSRQKLSETTEPQGKRGKFEEFNSSNRSYVSSLPGIRNNLSTENEKSKFMKGRLQRLYELAGNTSNAGLVNILPDIRNVASSTKVPETVNYNSLIINNTISAETRTDDFECNPSDNSNFDRSIDLMERKGNVQQYSASVTPPNKNVASTDKYSTKNARSPDLFGDSDLDVDKDSSACNCSFDCQSPTCEASGNSKDLHPESSTQTFVEIPIIDLTQIEEVHDEMAYIDLSALSDEVEEKNIIGTDHKDPFPFSHMAALKIKSTNPPFSTTTPNTPEPFMSPALHEFSFVDFIEGDEPKRILQNSCTESASYSSCDVDLNPLPSQHFVTPTKCDQSYSKSDAVSVTKWSRERAEFGILDSHSEPFTQSPYASPRKPTIVVSAAGEDNQTFSPLPSPESATPMKYYVSKGSSQKFAKLLEAIEEEHVDETVNADEHCRLKFNPVNKQPAALISLDDLFDDLDKLIYGTPKRKSGADVPKQPVGLEQLLTAKLSFRQDNVEEFNTPKKMYISPTKQMRLNSQDAEPAPAVLELPAELKISGQTYNVRLTTTHKPEFTKQTECELQRQLYIYGIKPLPRNKACKLLQHIYNQTHPIIVLDDDDSQRENQME